MERNAEEYEKTAHDLAEFSSLKHGPDVATHYLLQAQVQATFALIERVKDLTAALEASGSLRP